MTDSIIKFFSDLFNNDIITIIVVSMFPIVELRGALPVAFKLNMPWYQAYGLAFLGSMLVVPILLLLLKPLLEAMKKVKFFAAIANAVEDMFQSKAKSISLRAGKSNSEKREVWIKAIGVFAFVALPIPLTGVWTGSAVAVFLGLKFWQSFPAIFLGNLTAGAIVTLICVFAREHLDLILNIFFIIVIFVLVLFIVKLIIRIVKNKKGTTKDIEPNKDITKNDDNSKSDLDN